MGKTKLLFVLKTRLYSIRISLQTEYHKVVYKSRRVCAIFQLFGAASIQVWLFFEGGFYAMFWVCKTGKSGPEHEKWKCNLTLRVLQNYSKREQTFWQAKKMVGFSSTSTTWPTFHELWLLFKCGLSATGARRKYGFLSSATFIHDIAVWMCHSPNGKSQHKHDYFVFLRRVGKAVRWRLGLWMVWWTIFPWKAPLE